MKIVSFLILCIIWGTTWLAIKITLEGFPPFTGAAVRFMIAATSLFLIISAKKISFKVTKKDYHIIVVTAFLTYALDYGLIFWGEKYLSAGVTSIFFATFVLFASIWTNFLFRSEKFQWQIFIGLLLGFAGIIIVFLDQLLITDFDKMIILASSGIVIGAAGGAMSMVMVKKYLPKMDPFILTFHQLLPGIFFLAVFGLLTENMQAIHLDKRVIISVFYLGLVGSAIAFVMYYKLLKIVSVITISLIVYITPIIALIGDYIIFGEIISLRSVIGMVIIFTGIGLTQNKKWKQPIKTEKVELSFYE